MPNGFLVGVQDATKPANDRTFVNDANGHVLLKRQVEAQGENQVVHFLRQLVVDGNVLAVYGAGTDPKKPANDQNDPRFDNAQGNFDLNYQPITTGYPGPAAGQYTVRGGDTLKTIAQSAYGDVSLWYLIADANGLRGDQDLRIGETLVVPNRVGGAHNTADTFKPYDPSKVVGDTTPNLPVPQASGGGGCGALGIILTIVIVVVAVAATVYTAGLATTALGPALGSVGAAVAGGAIGGAVGSIVSQGLSMAVGLQKDFSWNQVALGALAGGVGAGVGQAFNAVGLTAEAGTAGEWALAGARSAVSSAATQGIAVVTGLQHDFSWRSVAASAVGAGVGAAVSTGVGAVMNDVDSIGKFGKGLITGTISGLAAGATVAAMRGGRIDVVRVAADAFGNALGNAAGEVALKSTQEMMQENAQREADAESLTLRLDGKRASDIQNYQLRPGGLLLTEEELRNTASANPAAVDDKLVEEQMRAEAGGRGRDVALLADASDVLARLGLSGGQMATDAPLIDLTDSHLGFIPRGVDDASDVSASEVAAGKSPVANDDLKLGKNERYRAAILLAAERTGIPAASIAAVISMEAAPLEGARLNEEANKAFYARHPELEGEPIGADQTALAEEWVSIRNDLRGSWDERSHNPSSASGLTQFIDRTWKTEAGRQGTYLNAEATRLGYIDASGKILNESKLMDMRYDPTVSIVAAAEYDKMELGIIAAGKDANGKALIPNPLSGDEAARYMYLGHHEGSPNAKLLLQNNLSEETSLTNLISNQPNAWETLKAAAGSAKAAYRSWVFTDLLPKVNPSSFR